MLRTDDTSRPKTAAGASTPGHFLVLTAATAANLCSAAAAAAEITAEERSFFESKIRPVLVENCYECHNSSGTRKGKLALDHRDSLLAGGSSGPAIVPGDAGASLLIRAVRHELDDLRMPKNGPRLGAEERADLARWVEAGAPDPRDAPPTAEDLARATSWEVLRERRKRWWSFQPIKAEDPPDDGDPAWTEHLIDRFVSARWREAGLRPSPEADRRTLARRLHFVLTGLPPTPEELRAFLEDGRPGAYERLVDRLLESPHFGERWARHWMDWVRYAESHGSEGDPAIPFAWRYRDYLIRALNADVPYDQLLREHLAGDLLPEPRVDPETGLNESALGVAHLRFVQHGFAPTDALDELVRFTNDQIDVVTKAFQGLTVACARCHHHKFDAISQDDFYALFGIFASTRPAVITVDAPGRSAGRAAELKRLKAEVKQQLAAAWMDVAKDSHHHLAKLDAEPWKKAVEAAKDDRTNPLHAWHHLRAAPSGEEAAAAKDIRERLAKEYRASLENLARRDAARLPARWSLADADDYASWTRHGTGLDAGPAPAGSFRIPHEGERAVDAIFPAGAYTHLLSTKDSGVASSPRFFLGQTAKRLYLRAFGGGGARARYAVQNYPRSGTVYPITNLKGERPAWTSWDVVYWRGDHAHFEVGTGQDNPVVGDFGAGRSWFGVTEAVALDEAAEKAGLAPRDEMAEFAAPLFEAAGRGANLPLDPGELAMLYRNTLGHCIVAWRDGTMTDAQARFLDFFLRHDLLPTRLADLPEALRQTVGRYRQVEGEIPVPTRAPGVLETVGYDQPLFVRGDHKKPAHAVPRRYLEALGGDPYPLAGGGSGRLQLAEDWLRPGNPFTARVIVNRLWHHLLGRGLVATPDNFGRLGEQPSHPALLDALAHRFVVEDAWSLKAMIRHIVTSKTFRLSSAPPAGAAGADPGNRLLTHYPARRLEAEAIRDALLAVSGRIDRTLYGSPQGGNSGRRSVYLGIRRNSLDPFLTVFDAPVPVSTTGRRDATNVPAQSLTLMNDPFVIDQARHWAGRSAEQFAGQPAAARIDHLFLSALGRPPTKAERRELEAFVLGADERAAELALQRESLEGDIAQAREGLQSITAPARARVLAARKERKAAGGDDADVRPRPIAHWSFDRDLKDALGPLHATAHGGARLEGGALVLDGKGFARTAPLPADLREKTLEARVQLDGLGQRGGGVITVQTGDGHTFDAIVFGERQERHWIAGSDRFNRTQDFGGPADGEAADRPVHLAITYRADGTITAYREGKPYGKPYRPGGILTYKKGDAVVLFGLRHGAPGGNRLLRGRIHEARLYDRALSPEEVAAAAGVETDYVSQEQLLAALSPPQRKELTRLEARLEELGADLAQLPETSARPDPQKPWQDLAQAVFNFKEFIYLR